jgi:uncharacterized lipoprotein YddW (UPF0748 family)
MSDTIKKLLALMLCLVGIVAAARDLPEPKRDFRGCWIQCVNGQFSGLSRESMQQRLTQQLDALQKCHVNVVFFQVRAEADALYASNLEPWSRFLTGKQGVSPGWDPLAWMIDQCHQRGMQLHAWINPYRAKTAATKELASSHPYNRNPERFLRYGDLLIFNPALEENRRYICQVVTDILQRYDVDGLHMDDYFYPYPQAGVDIPDGEFFERDNRGFRDIRDWRRDNVDRLIRELHETIRSTKPWAIFSVAPFGIYHNSRNGGIVPGSATGGLQNYDDLYADVLQWVNKGWIDVCIPQIYWQIGHPTADYDTLVRWWAQFAGNRPLVIGQDIDRTVKYADVNDSSINQLPAKMRLQRLTPNVVGNALWYSAAVAENHGSYATALSQYYQTHPALLPPMPFIDSKAPKKVKGVKSLWTPDGPVLVWLNRPTTDPMQQQRLYVVYRFAPGEKKDLNDASHIVTVTTETFLKLPYTDGSTKYRYYVTALDRLQNESKAKSATVKL